MNNMHFSYRILYHIYITRIQNTTTHKMHNINITNTYLFTQLHKILEQIVY